MTIEDRIEKALENVVERAGGPGAPPRLVEAVRYALFPGGGRMRPRLCLGVAAACGVMEDPLVDAAAASIELMHCASLVHDDLPCFDDADMRRGKPSVHREFGEPIAVLTGDAMIVLAFESLCHAAAARPQQLPQLARILARSVGMPNGIIAGQAWESETSVNLVAYQRAKTGSLFVAAVECGASAAGSDPAPWTLLGSKLGEAYQVADDLNDAVTSAEEMGKPAGQDTAHDRPNVVSELGVALSLKRLKTLLTEAIASVPAGPGASELRAVIEAETRRFIPRSLAQCAA
jgi:geranylgeranyl diphosphate synthase, type II